MFGFNVAFKLLLSYRLFEAVVRWPMCCHTWMPCRRHATWHPTLSQYTSQPVVVIPINVERLTEIHNYPFVGSWVRPDRDILPDLPQLEANAPFNDAVSVVVRQKLGWNCTRQVLNPGPVVYEPITPSARLQLFLDKYCRVLYYR